MAGIVDAVSAFVNPANIMNTAMNTGIGLALGAAFGNPVSAAGALQMAATSHTMNSVMRGITPRPNTGAGLANALNTYSQAQPATAQPQNNQLGQILQNVGDAIVSRIETTNALVQKLIDVQTGKEELDYRRKATQYGRMAQSLSRTAMGRIFLSVMSKTMGRAGAELNYMTQGALNAGVTSRKEMFTTKLLSQIPMMQKYFGKSMDILAKNILRVQSPFTKETDVTINRVLPKRLEIIGKLVDKRLTESNEHLKIIATMSTETRGELNNFTNFMKESVEHYKRVNLHQAKFEDAIEQTFGFVNENVGQFFVDTKHHYTEVERILERTYTVLSTTLPQLVGSVDQINARAQVLTGVHPADLDQMNRNLKDAQRLAYFDRKGNRKFTDLETFTNHYLSNRYPERNNKGNSRQPNDYGKNKAENERGWLIFQSIEKTSDSLNALATSLAESGPNNLLAKAMQMSLDSKSKGSGLSLMDCLSRVIQQQQEAAQANQEGQEKLQKTIASRNEDKGWLSSLGETASGLLTTAIDTKNAFLHFGMNLPNLLTRTLSSVLKIGIGMFLGRQLIGLLYKVFTGSTSNIAHDGFIGTLWHDGIFSAIMYAKDKIAGYLGDALNWVFKAITGNSFRETVDSYYQETKKKVWDSIVGSIPKMLGYIFTAVTAIQFGKDVLMPIGKSIASGIMGFIPNVMKGAWEGIRTMGGAIGGAINTLPIVRGVANTYKKIVGWFDEAAKAGALNPSVTNIVQNSVTGHYTGIVKFLMEKAGNTVKSRLEQAEQRQNMLQGSFLPQMRSTWRSHIINTTRQILGYDKTTDTTPGWVKGLRIGTTGIKFLTAPLINITSGIFSKIGNVVGNMIGPILKNPLLIPMLLKTVTKMFDSVMGSMFNESQLALMGTGDKVKAFVGFLFEKAGNIIASAFKLLNPKVILDALGGLVGGFVTGIKGMWNNLFGDDRQHRIVAVVDEKTQEQQNEILQRQNEASIKLIDAWKKSDQEKTNLLTTISKSLDTAKNAIMSGFEWFMDMFKPRNLGFMRGKFDNFMTSLMGVFLGQGWKDQEEKRRKDNADSYLNAIRAAINPENAGNLLKISGYKEGSNEYKSLKEALTANDNGGNSLLYKTVGGKFVLNPNFLNDRATWSVLGPALTEYFKQNPTKVMINEKEHLMSDILTDKNTGYFYATNQSQYAKQIEDDKIAREVKNSNNIGEIATTTKDILAQTQSIYGKMSGKKAFAEQLEKAGNLESKTYNPYQESFKFNENDITQGMGDHLTYNETGLKWNKGDNLIESDRKSLPEVMRTLALSQLNTEDRKRLFSDVDENLVTQLSSFGDLNIGNAVDWIQKYKSIQSGNESVLLNAFTNTGIKYKSNLDGKGGYRAFDNNHAQLISDALKSIGWGNKIKNEYKNEEFSDFLRNSKFKEAFLNQVMTNGRDLIQYGSIKAKLQQFAPVTSLIPDAINWGESETVGGLINQLRRLNDDSLKMVADVSGASIATVLPNSEIAKWATDIAKTYEIDLTKPNPDAVAKFRSALNLLYWNIKNGMDAFIYGARESDSGNYMKALSLPIGNNYNLITKSYNEAFVNAMNKNGNNFNNFLKWYNPITLMDDKTISSRNKNLHMLTTGLTTIGDMLMTGLPTDFQYLSGNDLQEMMQAMTARIVAYTKGGTYVNGYEANLKDGKWYNNDNQELKGQPVELSNKLFEFIGEPNYQSQVRTSSVSPYDSWTKAINFSLQWEGGRNFTIANGVPVIKGNAKNDLGGATAYGITIPTLKSAYKAGIVGHDDITRLTQEEAKQIYKRNFWERYKWNELSWPVSLMALDCSINHGGFAWILQRAAAECGQNITIDGKYGPQTLAALKACNPNELASAIVHQRAEYYKKIVAKNPTQSTFLKGWNNRNNAMAKAAGELGSIATTAMAENKIPSIATSSSAFNFNTEEMERARQYLNFGGNSGTLTSFMLMRPEMRQRVLGMAEAYYNSPKKLKGYDKLKINSAWRSTPYQSILRSRYTKAAAGNLATHYLGIAVDMDSGLVDWLRRNGYLGQYNLEAPFPDDPVHIQLPGYRNSNSRVAIADANNYPLSMQKNGLYMEPNLREKMSPEKFIELSLKYDPFIKNISSIVSEGGVFSPNGVSYYNTNSNKGTGFMSEWNIDFSKNPLLSFINNMNFENQIVSRLQHAGVNTDITNGAVNAMQLLTMGVPKVNSVSTSTAPAVTDTNVAEPTYSTPSIKNVAIAEPIPYKLPDLAMQYLQNSVLMSDYGTDKIVSSNSKTARDIIEQQAKSAVKIAADATSSNATTNEILKVLGNIAMAALKNSGVTNNILTNIANDTSNVSNNSNNAPRSQGAVGNRDMGIAASDAAFLVY